MNHKSRRFPKNGLHCQVSLRSAYLAILCGELTPWAARVPFVVEVVLVYLHGSDVLRLFQSDRAAICNWCGPSSLACPACCDQATQVCWGGLGRLVTSQSSLLHTWQRTEINNALRVESVKITSTGTRMPEKIANQIVRNTHYRSLIHSC